MITFFACLPFFILFQLIARAVANWFNVSVLTVWIVYFVVSELIESNMLTHSPQLRRLPIFAYLGRVVMRSDFTAESKKKLNELSSRQRLYMAETHGIACSHLVWGYAAHGGALPDHLADKTLVVASVVYKFVPILRNIYSALGVISNTRASIKRALRQGYSLALSPSGIVGKELSLIAPVITAASDDTACVQIWRRSTLGCFMYAHRYKLPIVTVLSPEEDYLYRRFNVDSGSSWKVLAIGWWFVRPYQQALWRIGDEIESEGVCNASKLADSVYASFCRLGANDYRVKVKYAIDE